MKTRRAAGKANPPFMVKGAYYITREGKQIIGPMYKWINGKKSYGLYPFPWTAPDCIHHYGDDGRISNQGLSHPKDLMRRVIVSPYKDPAKPRIRPHLRRKKAI